MSSHYSDHKVTYPMRLFMAFLAAAIAMAYGCSDSAATHDADADSREEETYLLVGGPCADGDYATAIRRADSLLSSDQTMSDSLRAFIMIEKDVALLESGDLSSSNDYADTVIQFGKDTGIALAVMQGLQNKGVINRRNGDYETAIACYSEGFGIAIAEKDPDMELTFAEMLAIACAERGRIEESLDFGQNALRIAREMEDPLAELNTISTIGGILANAGRYEEAISRLIPYSEEAGKAKPLLRVKYLTPLMKSYLALDSLPRAHAILDSLHTSLEGMPHMSQAYLVVVNSEAELARREGRHADRWHWLTVADSIGGMGIPRESLLSQRASCLADLGRYAEAYATEKNAYEALDSARTEDDNSRLAELSIRYGSLKKEAEISRLEAQRLKWIMVAAVCVAIMAAVAVAAVAYRRRLSIRMERERHLQYVKGIEEERRRMARELHDDIAGNIVGLQLQTATLPTADVAARLSSIARRVRRLSHELMPPEFRQLPLTSMFTDLTSRLNSYNTLFHITLTDKGSFNWDSLSPEENLELYRIVQEAVSNAMRHGVPGNVDIILKGERQFHLEVVNVADDSCSKPLSGHSPSAGLRSMRARAEIINADLSAGFDHENKLFILTITQRQ